MNLSSTIAATILSAGILAGVAAAQDFAAHTKKLNESFDRMLALESVAFETKDKPTKGGAGNALGGRMAFAGIGGGTRTADGVKGIWTSDLMSAESKNCPGMLMRNGRMLAKGKDGWVMRDGRTADGKKLPLIISPDRLFLVLKELDPKVRHQEVATLNDRPIQRFTVTLDKKKAAELDWAGLLSHEDPSKAMGRRGGGNFAINVLGGGGGVTIPERTIDIVFYVDPSTNLVFEMRTRVHAPKSKNGNQGGAVVVFGGGLQVAGGDDDEEEEDEDEAEDGPMTFEEGFPKRSKKKFTTYEYWMSFDEHDQASAPALSEKAKRLLGVQ